MKLKHKRIALIDDTPAILTFLRASLEALGAECHEAQTASGGLAMCTHFKPDLVVLDLGLPDKEGFDILPRLKRMDKPTPVVIVLTVRSDPKYRKQAMELGADAYMTKPFHMEDLIEVIYDRLGLGDGNHLSLVKPEMQAG